MLATAARVQHSSLVFALTKYESLVSSKQVSYSES